MNFQRFREIILSRGYTFRSCAKVTGIPESTLYKYVIANRNPSTRTAAHIANVLKMSDQEYNEVFRA